MDLSEEHRETLRTVARDLLTALEEVANAAADSLSGSSLSTNALADGSKSITGDDRPARQLSRIRLEMRQHIERILREPFVNMVRVRWDDARVDTLYVTRGSAAGIRCGRTLTTQAAPLGHLATLEPGETGEFRGKEYEILERVDLRPTRGEIWDALDDRLLIGRVRAVVDSLRRFVSDAEQEVEPDDILAALRAVDEDSALIRDKLQRHVISRMTLRDQPTLDRHQDEVSRLFVDHRVLLLGPPGTGKTTTLIRRLAFKRHPEGLVDDERDLLGSIELGEAFGQPDGWMMFSPTDLLQRYLRDAFNRELVPATDRNLRTWERERRDLGVHVLGILRGAGDGSGFILEKSGRFLWDETSPAVSALHDAFAPYALNYSLERLRVSFENLSTSEDERVAMAVQELRSLIGLKDDPSPREVGQLLEHGGLLREEATRLKQETDEQINRTANRLLRAQNSKLLEELVEGLPLLRTGVAQDEEDEDEDEDDVPGAMSRNAQREAAELLVSGLRQRARQLASGRGRRPSPRIARLIELLGSRMPADDQLVEVGQKLLTMRDLRTVMRAPRDFVMKIPAAYRRFRRANSAAWLSPDVVDDVVRTGRISAVEVDVVILVMLGLARRLMDLDTRRYGTISIPDWLEMIRRRYVPQVYVDEATDFSAVQLACMMELSHPRLCSWFACGDFRQRITTIGIRDDSELAWVSKTVRQAGSIDCRDVSVGYRQSPRLATLTRALEVLNGNSTPGATEVSGMYEEQDVLPLLAENVAGLDLARWIGARVVEIGQVVKPLPSIAVFVDGEERIDALVRDLSEVLEEHNVPVAACRGGRDIGDRQELRVFDIQHIKGLEFEAVFLTGIDGLAQRLPELFARYVYVGATRAATYLGLTAEGELPAQLESLRPQFSNRGWAA